MHLALRSPLKLPWPLPALLAWALGWALFALLAQQGPWVAFGVAQAVVAALALTQAGAWRRGIVALGFPASALALLPSLPPWVWGLAIVPLVMAYPLRAWRDAPWFPTAANALDGLDRVIALPKGANVLDAGCGLGDGLRELQRLWPQARLQGIEWSRPLAWLAARRCRDATIRRGNMWRDDWSGVALLYVFQRPETMPRLAAKAHAEMHRSSWIVSLEFPLPGWTAHAHIAGAKRRDVWVYRIS